MENPADKPNSRIEKGGIEGWQILDIDASEIKPTLEIAVRKYWDQLPEEEKHAGRLRADMMRLVMEVIESIIPDLK